MSISSLVTAIFPTTEAILSGDSSLGYATHKAAAIARAKVVVYAAANSTAPSDEGDIPDLALYAIADQAAVYLIPLAVDFYMVKHRQSDSKEGASISYYDKIGTLERLKDELTASVERAMPAVIGAISSGYVSVDDVPAVSVDGLIVNPDARAILRGAI